VKSGCLISEPHSREGEALKGFAKYAKNIMLWYVLMIKACFGPWLFASKGV
jgi:hypothetical protein